MNEFYLFLLLSAVAECGMCCLSCYTMHKLLIVEVVCVLLKDVSVCI